MAQVLSETTRATGITAYLLLFATIVLGLALSEGSGAWWRGVPVYTLHRFCTRLLAVFLSVHVLVLFGDSSLYLRAVELVYPPLAAREPIWTTAGVLAVYLLVLVAASTALRRRLRSALWYGLHLLTYPAFIAATAHGVMVGSDTRLDWMQAMYLGCALVTTGLLAARFAPRELRGFGRFRRWAPSVFAAAALSAMVLVLLGIRLGGPLALR